MNGPVKTIKPSKIPMQALGLALAAVLPAGLAFFLHARGMVQVLWVEAGSGAASVIIVLLVFLFFVRKTGLPLSALRQAVESGTTGGGLQKDLPRGANDDVNRLAGSIETIAAHQRMLVEKIKTSAFDISEAEKVQLDVCIKLSN